MIEVVVLQAKGNIHLGKNATFLDGELYFGRESKDGSSFVIRSEQGYWIPVFSYRLTVNRLKYKEIFNRRATIYMKNRKRLNNFVSVEHYFNSGNAKKWWYDSQFKDLELYG
ncbi:hypothetical protein PQE75_gp141 [Bacillus phage vB_BcoS-136]|uniref:Uncharacterized protein n=1 Tax=Bacillus phage vB_BcoS-136 TaxID=2419619 RepID=A0A3G3BVQ1_9CAUD|nr:hypothetical protein PQE75_gp141 [Bacillus phage vB_BcoS-136]AYP68338.1 hypothetical protein vBBcoS136_00224 [Bacillus phage vB_BcoS-136]